MAPTEVFWSQPAPFEHSVQIHADQQLLMDALEGFASSGLRAGDAVLVIATEPHRRALDQRLRRRGFALDQARAEQRYLPLDAAGSLAQFMVDGWPDEARVNDWAGRLVRQAGAGRRVRAFGEMVALLWKQGQSEAALRLENLWDEQCRQAGLWLFCAYPRQCFAGDPPEGLRQVCAHHARVFPD